MKDKSSIQDRPNVSKVLWWDWDYEKMNFHKAYIAVIGRIIEHGDEEEYAEMIRFYGKEKVIHAIKYEIKFLADYAIEKVCDYFSLKKEEIWCYRDKQSRPNYWI